MYAGRLSSILDLYSIGFYGWKTFVKINSALLAPRMELPPVFLSSVCGLFDHPINHLTSGIELSRQFYVFKTA